MKTFTRHSPSIKSSSSNNVDAEMQFTATAIAVKTFTDKPSKQLDLTKIHSQADLDTIKSQDPFMYYSIPGVRSAKVLFNDDMDIDTAGLSQLELEDGRRRRSCPDRIEIAIDECDSSSDESSCAPSAPQEEEQQCPKPLKKVTRETRMSFECHPDLLLEGIY